MLLARIQTLKSSRLKLLPLSLYAGILSSLRGWRTSQKILVIESDDWGSIRTSGQHAYAKLRDHSYILNSSCYSLDALETNDDLERLFDLLDGFKDCLGRSACFTANMVMANPDFQRIEESGFQKYFYKSVTEQMEGSEKYSEVAKYWRTGFNKRLFIPQLHCREHISWWSWLASLRQGSEEALITYDLEMCGVPLAVSKEDQSFFTPLFLCSETLDQYGVNLDEMISEGFDLFEKTFGFKSLSTVAPNVTWTEKAERLWSAKGVKYIQGGWLQWLDTAGGMKARPHYSGEQNSEDGLLYMVRNCTFEPAKLVEKFSWRGCLAQIEKCFSRNQPAVVCSHRVNYIGDVDACNRDRGLGQLRKLLEAVCRKWPDIHFISSPELGYMIENGVDKVVDLENYQAQIFPSIS